MPMMDEAALLEDDLSLDAPGDELGSSTAFIGIGSPGSSVRRATLPARTRGDSTTAVR